MCWKSKRRVVVLNWSLTYEKNSTGLNMNELRKSQRVRITSRLCVRERMNLSFSSFGWIELRNEIEGEN